jgi:tight adherence protein B
MDSVQILLIVLAAAALLGIGALTLLGPNPQKESTRRLQSLRFRHADSADARMEAQMRRAVAQRKPHVPKIAGSASRTEALALRLHRTGRNWTIQQYLYACAGTIGVVTLLLLAKSGNLMLSIAVGLAVGIGLPHMVVGSMIKRRLGSFVAKFPDAIELLVRGLRSGLPVTETLGIVSSEVPGPVGEEFKLVTERIKIGRTMEDALQDTADRLNMPEFSFFCITLAIQRETGGNLAETLANLADVLRKRAQMKLKIKAMSSESKASAYIVGSLPFIVFIMIYWINPPYLSGFFTDQRLIITGLGGLCWMGIGAFIMAQMVNFEI